MGKTNKKKHLLILGVLAGFLLLPSIPKPVEANPKSAPDMPINELINFVVSDLNSYWNAQFNYARRQYAPPKLIQAYTQQIQTPCGNALLNNAFYCPASHSIYYDANFLYKVYSQVGDFAAVSIIAHEWGHLVQRQMGIVKGPYLSIQTELQADCLSGAYAKHAGEKSYLEEGDLDEAGAGLFKFGDPRGMPWFDMNAHGKPLQRVSAFLDGLKQGPGGCFSR
jgi:predicted metalloprotease